MTANQFDFHSVLNYLYYSFFIYLEFNCHALMGAICGISLPFIILYAAALQFSLLYSLL